MIARRWPVEQWLLLLEKACKDPRREAEFNDWYDRIHIPDILSGSPGFKSAIRYILYAPVKGQSKYLAVYEIETADIDRTMASHKANVETTYAAGRKSDLLEIVSRKLCKGT
jgi:hypothetical protein